MSLQDDIFDVMAAVEGTDAEKSFERVKNMLYHYENRLGEVADELVRLKDSLRLVGSYLQPEGESHEGR